MSLRRRPVTRRDCLPGGINAQRPCRQGWCRHHMDGPESCSLDASGPGVIAEAALAAVAPDTCPHGAGRTLDEVGALIGVTREGVRVIEARALVKLALTSPGAPEHIGTLPTPERVSSELVEDFERIDEDALLARRIERALEANPSENDKAIAEIVGTHAHRVGDVRRALGIAAVSGWGSKS